MYLSAYLMAMGRELKSHDSEGRDTRFCFEQDSALRQLIDLYYSFNVQINPQRYGSAIKMLKNLIYQSNDNYKTNGTRITHNFRAIK